MERRLLLYWPEHGQSELSVVEHVLHQIYPFSPAYDSDFIPMLDWTILYYDETPVGVCGGVQTERYGFFISVFGIIPGRRRNGWGRLLLTAVIYHYRNVQWAVPFDDHEAQIFLHRCGHRPICCSDMWRYKATIKQIRAMNK